MLGVSRIQMPLASQLGECMHRQLLVAKSASNNPQSMAKQGPDIGTWTEEARESVRCHNTLSYLGVAQAKTFVCAYLFLSSLAQLRGFEGP